MEATVLGCGEAFDNDLFNTSVLLRDASGPTMLLDCGYSIPAQLWKAAAEPDAVDLIYISHPHADHFFGLPAVLGRMWEDGRRKRLHIVSQRPVIDQIQAAMELGYRGLSRRFEYAIDFHPAEAGRPLDVLGARFQFAETRHSVTNYAVRIEIGGLAVCYSGDGVYTEASRALFRDANLLIHEAYSFDQSPVHGDIPGVIALAEEQFVAQLALVHVQRAVRRSQEFLERIHRMGDGTMLTLPHPGAVLYLE